jgi:hypothetical protein
MTKLVPERKITISFEEFTQSSRISLPIAMVETMAKASPIYLFRNDISMTLHLARSAVRHTCLPPYWKLPSCLPLRLDSRSRLTSRLLVKDKCRSWRPLGMFAGLRCRPERLALMEVFRLVPVGEYSNALRSERDA